MTARCASGCSGRSRPRCSRSPAHRVDVPVRARKFAGSALAPARPLVVLLHDMVVPSGLGGVDDWLRHLNGRANARASVWRPSNRRKQMKLIGLIAASFAMAATAAAQDAVPSLTGAWKGTGKILLYGTTEHLSGSTQNAVVRDLEVTHKVEARPAGSSGARRPPRTTTAGSRLRGRFRATTKPSSARTPTAITGSRSCRPIGSKNATPRAQPVPGARSSPPVS